MWTPHSATVHPNNRHVSACVPTGTSQCAQRLNAILSPSSSCANSLVKEGAGLEHHIHSRSI